MKEKYAEKPMSDAKEAIEDERDCYKKTHFLAT